jgi:hypothetical protein
LYSRHFSLADQSNSNEFVKYQQLKDENTHLKKTLELQQQTEKDYNEQIHTLQLRIKELEDWNGDTIEIQNKVIFFIVRTIKSSLLLKRIIQISIY